MHKLAFAVFVFLLSWTPTHGQDAAPQAYGGIAWQPVFGKALQMAKKESRPIMIAFVLRGESANESICGEHFLDKEIIELSRKFVCLLAYAKNVKGENGGSTQTSDGYVTTFAQQVTGAQLKKVESEARIEFLEAGQVSAPQFLFVHPDGEKILLRHVWLLSPAELLQKMHKALHFYDTKHVLPKSLAVSTESDLVEIKKLIIAADGKNMMTRREAMTKVAIKEHPMVIDFLIKQTGKDVDQSRRLEAVRAMGQNGQVKYLPCLHRLLRKERGFQVRSNVATSIGAVGLVESVTPILKILKKEKKKQLRSILIQSLMSCGKERSEVAQPLAKILKSGGDLDKITILYRLANSKWRSDYHKPLLKCLKSSNAQVRAAAYFVVGSHKQTALTKTIKGRLSSEKHIARNACAWSLKQLGQDPKMAAESPSSDISILLPSASY